MLNHVPTGIYLSEDKDDMGYNDLFAGDSGEKQPYTVGANTAKIPTAPNTENAKPITADAVKQLLAERAASGGPNRWFSMPHTTAKRFQCTMSC